MWFSATGRWNSQPFPDINIKYYLQTEIHTLDVCNIQLRWCEQAANVCKKMSYYIYLVHCYEKGLPVELEQDMMALQLNGSLYNTEYGIAE